MAKYFIAVAAATLVTMCSAQPTGPLRTGGCVEEGMKVVDANNMCWYHECTITEGGLTYIPRRCALGSKVSYNFVEGQENPCTINFDDVTGYSCRRTQQSVDGPPPCWDPATRPVCYNGGTPTFEADKCWCICPSSWAGHHDCSLPTLSTQSLPAGSNICVDGEPLEDWCRQPNGGCLNNGVCYNQCDTFWCDCPEHERYNYVGKRCEL